MNCQGRHLCFTLAICSVLIAGCRTGSSSPDAAFPSAAVPPPRLERLPLVENSGYDVVLASHQVADELPPPNNPDTNPDTPPSGEGIVEPAPEVIPTNEVLRLGDVIRSVQESYPLLVTAMLERNVAEGKQLSAWGEFDLNVKGFGIAAPEGFYRTYRNGISLTQPVFKGGYVYGGYKIGDGNFQPWFGERETNEGGEFSTGFGVPLLKDRRIDKRRAAVFQADLARQAVEPAVQAQMLEFVRVASKIYWEWVAAGQDLLAQQELLRNAQARVRQIEEKVNGGDLPKIARINNDQLIASRETKVIQSERKLEKAAIKLSLFFRSIEGQPVVPDASRLPTTFPTPAQLDAEQINDDIALAIAASPILNELDLFMEQVNVDLRNAQNMMLPKLDAMLLASKDVGRRASSKGDKTPFELEAGLYGEIPLQRREARGKIAAAEGKLSQLNAKRQFVINKITAAVQDSVSALEAAAGRIDRATTNLRLARETLRLGRIQFDAGDIDLIALNIYEREATDAQLLLIEAQADFFSALADYHAALSQAPLIDE